MDENARCSVLSRILLVFAVGADVDSADGRGGGSSQTNYFKKITSIRFCKLSHMIVRLRIS